MGRYSAEKRALLEKAAAAAALHGGVTGASVDRGGKPTPENQEEIDARASHPDAWFMDNNPRGQMEMRVNGDDQPFHLPKTLTNEDGIHEYADETEPYATRPAPQGKQLALGKSGAFRPTDPALHNIRQQNPHLNDYTFHMTGSYGTGQIHTVTAIHTPSGSQAGALSWKGKEYAERHYPGEGRAGEVEMVEVKDQHRGRGLSSAMWDYAHHQASREGSEIAHPVHSDNRSVEGNHWAHFVGGASMARTKGFNVKSY